MTVAERIALATAVLVLLGMLLDLKSEIGDMRQELNSSIAASNQNLNGEIADLKERMARLEGLMDGFVQRKPSSAEVVVDPLMARESLPDESGQPRTSAVP